MKKLLLSIAALAAIVPAFAQDAQEAAAKAAAALTAAQDVPEVVKKPVYWTESILTNINFTQTSLTNWVAGGYDNYTLTANIDANANYLKDKMKWNNRLQLDYGFLYSEDKPLFQKNKDRIYFESKWGFATPVQHLDYSASFDFKTQFDNNYTYKTPATSTDTEGNVIEPTTDDWKAARVLKSGFFAPAYINLGLGLDWTPTKWLSVNFAPVTGSIVAVDIPDLRKTYGMALKDGIETATSGDDYRSMRFAFGAQLKADAKFVINDNLNYTTQLVLFTDYLNQPITHTRINWDNKVFWKIAKYFALTFSTNMIYDPEVIVTLEDSTEVQSAVQFKEFFEFGFTYTFSPRKK